MTMQQAMQFLADHGYAPNQQTATLNGEWVESGTSFFETFGVRESYDQNQVRVWMGY